MRYVHLSSEKYLPYKNIVLFVWQVFSLNNLFEENLKSQAEDIVPTIRGPLDVNTIFFFRYTLSSFLCSAIDGFKLNPLIVRTISWAVDFNAKHVSHEHLIWGKLLKKSIGFCFGIGPKPK